MPVDLLDYRYVRPAPNPACPEDEHDQIVAAIERRDEKAAIELMLHHLEHIESALNLTSNHRDDVDWDQILG